MNVTIVGLGALGSHLVLFARNWKASLDLIDFDKVEARNVDSQFHPKSSMGKGKALSLTQSMQGLFGTKTTSFPRKVDARNVEALLGAANLVIDCTDNLEARQVLMGFCKQKGIPCLHGALSAAGDFGLVAWDEDFKPDSEAGTTGHTCENGDALPFFALAAAQLAVTAQEFLTSGRKRSFQITKSGTTRIA